VSLDLVLLPVVLVFAAIVVREAIWNLRRSP
jgi:hypothetical protein